MWWQKTGFVEARDKAVLPPLGPTFVYFSAAFMTNSCGILDLMSGSVVIVSRR
jgi:hypothetical protein